ncbi:trypsin-like peptidase domain-containing protein [Pontibaca methylaminivorans]|nr:trypsin-like peptidase domain-containing protein [Pontibaca methylaminivorans]
MTRLIRPLTAALMLGLAVPAVPAHAEARVPRDRAEIGLGFAPVVKEVAPAVVSIYARRIIATRQSPFMDDPFFREFFGDIGQMRPQVQNSLGSGVILSGDGIVVTNYHVIGAATDIRVVLKDRREFGARVILGDEESDLAVLKLDVPEELPHLALRDSDRVEVGELVLAIGNPFGVGQTVSSGIISGLARSGVLTGQVRGYFLQTDAPINPGNSGGALVDVNGALIGINTSILSRSGGSNGIGFAIPSNLVGQFVEQARAGNERFERPWAGMTGQPVEADMAASLGLSVPGGVLVSDLHAESPFAGAGLQVGDVVTHVDGQPVDSPSEMLFRMSVAGVGASAHVAYMREGREQVADVAMIRPPETPEADERRLPRDSALPGLALARVNPALIARLDLPLSTQGVIVTEPGPYGARAGLRTGDVIARVNGAPVETSAAAARALEARGRWMVMDVLRRGQPLQLRFRL